MNLLNESMVLKASELAVESEKRAAAEKVALDESVHREMVERNARLDAEGRIAVFSNVIHHLNNPLSHLQGAYRSGNTSFDGLVNTLFFPLLHPSHLKMRNW